MEITKRQLQDEELTAYHGGPHSFDKFSTQHMGTGEGNQVFGWGLYFTDSEDIAKYYAEKLGDDSSKIWNKIKEIFYKGLDLNNIDNFNYTMIEDIQSGKMDIKKAVNRLKNSNISLRNVSDEKIAELFNKALNLERQKKFTYKVTLHKGKTPEQYNWLEWDKPLTDSQKKLIIDQSRKENLKTIKYMTLRGELTKKSPESAILYSPKSLGKSIYYNITDYFKSDKEASLFLLRAGIDGIKYPANSLSKTFGGMFDVKHNFEEKGFNYVVFDENAVNIEKQTQLEGMEISKKELIQNKKLKEDAEDVNFMGEITKGELEEAKKARTKLRKKKKADRCLRIARRKMPQTSAYRSGNIVRCRQGDIWTDLKEEETTKGNIHFEHEHLDHYDGQDNYELGIYEDDEVIGYVQYVIFENEITVSDILVRPNRRRENFGSMLIKKMKQLHPNAKYKPSMKTDLGSKFIHKDVDINEKWSEKYKGSIDCNNPKGFSQKAHCKGRLKEGEANFGSDDINLSDYNGITVEKGRSKVTERGTIQNIIVKYNGKPITGENNEPGLGNMNVVIQPEDAFVGMIRIPTELQGKGLSKYIYQATANLIGVPIINSKERGQSQSESGGYVWKNRDSFQPKTNKLNEKTDFSKEKEQGLHGWFARQGGKGKSKGWVDCNTCRDGKCKSCGRKEGEKRSKYPACRPTPSACKTKGKGKSWGKKNEEFPIQSLYREKQNMEIKKKDIFDEDLVLKRSPSDKKIYVQSDLSDESARKKETFKNKEALKGAGFTWDGKNSAWNINDVNFMLAKKTIETINKKEYLVNQLEELEEIVFNTENFEGKNNLMDRIDLYINDLANATDEVAVSAEIRKYLTFFSKFRTYSLHNSMLIYIQSGGKATKVRTSPQWYKDFHRKIKAGAKAIWIYRPLNQNKSKNDDESGEEITRQNITRFVPFPTFDIADTEAIDERGEVPEEPNWFADLEPTERSIELYKYFIELCEDMGIQITKSGSERGEKGYSAGNKINISSAREGAGEVSTLVHEIAHELMHWKKSSIYYQENTSGELRELQAESVSYVVLKHYELPTEHHPTYLALWKANKDKIKANLKVISSVASFIISEIDRIEKRHQKNEVINEQVFKDVKNIFKRFMK